MTISDKERAYIEIYKGNDDKSVRKIYPDIPEGTEWYYATDLSYNNVNHFLNFIADPDSVPFDKVSLYHIEDMVEMVKALIHVSCEYALERPQPKEILYRFENSRNIPSYEKGELPSLKSTSKSSSESTVFDYQNAVALAFKTEGFCPFLSVDDVIDGGVFSDEKEILFPPFIKVQLTDDYSYTRSGDFQIVKVKDDFKEEGYIDKNQLEELYIDTMKNIEKTYYRDRKNKEVSEELSNQTFVIYNYLREYARNMFREYKQKYEQKHQKEAEKQY